MKHFIFLFTPLCLILSCPACGAEAGADGSFKADSSATPLNKVSEGTFTDVPADTWYAGAVAWCKENGIMSGTSENTFSPR